MSKPLTKRQEIQAYEWAMKKLIEIVEVDCLSGLKAEALRFAEQQLAVRLIRARTILDRKLGRSGKVVHK